MLGLVEPGSVEVDEDGLGPRRITFSGFTSRWTAFMVCSTHSVRQNCMAIIRVASGETGTLSLYPGTYLEYYPTRFDTYTGDAGSQSDAEETCGTALTIALLNLEKNVLTPNGYRLADLGFKSF